MLAGALAVLVARRWATAAAGLAAAAVVVRWGTTSLEAVAGAQGVLGPAALAGPALAALSQLCAATAIVLLAPGWAWGAVAAGSAAAFVAAGPGGAGGAPVRLLATVVAVGLALLARHLPSWRHPLGAALAAVALALAAAGT